MLRAARRAAVLTDARFLRVLDASEVDGVVYVVSEWVSATNLVDLLADGPLPPAEARRSPSTSPRPSPRLTGPGLAHLCLQPEHVLRTTHGQVKVGGLASTPPSAAWAEATADAARLDAGASARSLYAALTARWPGSRPPGCRPRRTTAPRCAARGRSAPACLTSWTGSPAGPWRSPAGTAGTR